MLPRIYFIYSIQYFLFSYVLLQITLYGLCNKNILLKYNATQFRWDKKKWKEVISEIVTYFKILTRLARSEWTYTLTEVVILEIFSPDS